MFEKKYQKVVSTSRFLKRMLFSFGLSIILVLVVLGIGILGYHCIEGLDWVDSLLNASMILGGMGPVNTLTNTAAKVFASFYALFSGLVFVALMGIVLAPVAHRVLHKFHVAQEDLR